jgi:hypothetical protein
LAAQATVADEPKPRDITVDKSAFSDIYPAVWFSPSTGEITPLKERSEKPPEEKYEIWIEPNDPEFGYNPDLKPQGVGFALLGKGEAIFSDPQIPEKPRIKLKITNLMQPSQGPENLVFFCQAKSCQCVIMVTAMDPKKQIIRFRWRLLPRK